MPMRVRTFASLVAFAISSACTAARAPTHGEQVRETCRERATVVETFRLAGPLADTIEIRSLSSARLAGCLRAERASDVEVSAELARARRRNDCRSQALEAVAASAGSASGQVEVVFDPARYDACVAGER